ncbi:MAG: AMP-binding protein, partial [Flavobacteriaceae bacterium]|nr:AMP-binding protein [Flavobacteriaceae bacterium]
MSTTVTRLFDFPYYQLEKHNLKKSLTSFSNGQWKSISTQEYIDQANAISRGLLRLGVQKDDKIAIISSTNRTEWNVCDIGILQIGAQNVPIYPTISSTDYEYVLNHSEATYCFVSDDVVLDKINQIKGKTKLKGIYTFDSINGEHSWEEILQLGKDESNQQEVEACKNGVSPSDLATLIYTSGTTGTPKGVMLTHKNIVENVLISENYLDLIGNKYRVVSYLPISHIFARFASYYYLYRGFEIHFAESLDKLIDNLKEIKPHFMPIVPRLLEKVYDAIVAKGNELTGLKRRLFFWSLQLGEAYQPYQKNSAWYYFKLKIAQKLIFKKW